jgi:hypothetical protein
VDVIVDEAEFVHIGDARPQLLCHPFDSSCRVDVKSSLIKKPLQDPADILIARRLIQESIWISALSHSQVEFRQLATDASPNVGHLPSGESCEAQGFPVDAFPQRERAIHDGACIIERNHPRSQDACRASYRRRNRFRARVCDSIGVVRRDAKHDIRCREDPIRHPKRWQRRPGSWNAVLCEDCIDYCRAEVHLVAFG